MTDLWAWIIGLFALLIPSLGPAPDPSFNGYVEADYIYVAPSSAGRIEAIAVDEGDLVQKGQLLVSMETTAQTAALRAATAGVAVAKANLANLSTGGRTAEVEVIRASLHSAEARQHLAATVLERSSNLLARGLVPSAQVDADRAALASADAQVDQLRAQLQVSELPARDAQRIAAEASLDMARAELAAAQFNLDSRLVRAPDAGKIEKRFFDPGEVAAAGAPVLSLFRPDNLKAIFFVPEAQRATLAVGKRLSVSCDGCAAGLGAEITRLADEPQYTPPILYSRDERGRLVFRAEARLLASTGFLPGQPVTLVPQK
ncbi:MAG: HlyD family efflux transporter periplasmic adaptor subunit [Cypionkella sp.]|nr:HlyD family efflux transporter periplasmic adaptor subunit [Cypionkella sp.]